MTLIKILSNKYTYISLGVLLVSILSYSLARSQSKIGHLETELRISEESLFEKSSEIRQLERELEQRVREVRDVRKIITTVTVRPDGTKIERTEKIEDKTKVLEETTDKSSERSETDVERRLAKKEQAQSSVGYSRSLYSVSLVSNSFTEVDREALDVRAGVRLGDMPIWVEVGARGDGTFYGGLRYEW